MKINYNITGANRKSLVSAISQELNAPVKYLGAPTFAYEVGGYHIDKTGTLRGDDNPGLIADLLGLHDFKAVAEEYDTPLPQAAPVPEDVRIPYEAALGGRVSPYRDYEEPPAYGRPEPTEPVESNDLTIEMPRSSFTDTALENLDRLVGSKGSLIKKALGITDLSILKGEETVSFPWFPDASDPDAVKAYTHFVTAICEMAKNQKRINAKEKETDNEKYAFRCFLLRLGFIGDKYKETRRILLRNLTGSAAFRTGVKKGFSAEDLDATTDDPAVVKAVNDLLNIEGVATDEISE